MKKVFFMLLLCIITTRAYILQAASPEPIKQELLDCPSDSLCWLSLTNDTNQSLTLRIITDRYTEEIKLIPKSSIGIHPMFPGIQKPKKILITSDWQRVWDITGVMRRNQRLDFIAEGPTFLTSLIGSGTTLSTKGVTLEPIVSKDEINSLHRDSEREKQTTAVEKTIAFRFMNDASQALYVMGGITYPPGLMDAPLPIATSLTISPDSGFLYTRYVHDVDERWKPLYWLEETAATQGTRLTWELTPWVFPGNRNPLIVSKGNLGSMTVHIDGVVTEPVSL